ncbi:uncharacterized protein LOC110694368 [Chenopodium quinoa]|uniref:uncharacterized protein LOC110694368 n=1 Tax=Chenopodium quinoa TaxID=63459 RepID=UPI000B788171|nr:uncharacterized protein LOC110694368 [Chenopodium quinoa]
MNTLSGGFGSSRVLYGGEGGGGLFELLETKVKASKFEKIFTSFYADWSVVANYGKGEHGRIWIIWEPEIFSVDVIKVEMQVIHVKVVHVASRGCFFCSMAYGVNRQEDREVLWKQLEQFGKLKALGTALDTLTFLKLEQISSSLPRITSNLGMAGFVLGLIVFWSAAWMDNFQIASAMFLPEGLMDHSPCVINFLGNIGSTKKPFKFFNVCTEYPRFLKLVADSWDGQIQGTLMFNAVKKLQRVKEALRVLNKQHFSSVISDDTSMEADLIQVQTKLNSDLVPEKIAEASIGFYKRLLGSSQNMERKVHHDVLDMGPVLNEEQGRNMCRPFNADDIVGNDITAAMLDFFQHGKLLNQVNTTMLTMVPKVENASKDVLKGYRDKQKSPRCTIKVDLRKAYDSISWDFIHDMLSALRFPAEFIKWIMQCISSASFSIMINGGLNGFFKGKKGIRQGDPMSPLLFVIVMEYLSKILRKVGGMRSFKFHSRCKMLNLNHLAVADDLMMFCYGDKKYVSLLVRALDIFGKCSGLQDILRVFGFVEGCTPFKYLGIPLNVRSLSNSDYDSLIDKMLARITCWSVLRKSPPISWDWICKTKKAGGLSMRDCETWNIAALGKYIWKIAQKEDSLWVKWVHVVYIKDSDSWDYKPKKNAGWVWKKLCKVKERLKEGFQNEG